MTYNYDHLGTSWKFQVHLGRLGTVYGVNVEGAGFRIAPEDKPHNDKWRIDYRGMGVWEAVTPMKYDSPEKAAAALVSLNRAHQLDEYKPKKDARGSLLDHVVRLAHEKPETRKHLLPLIRKFAANSYSSLSDAAEVTGNDKYLPGKTEIWYMKPSAEDDYFRGPARLKERGLVLPIPQTIRETHILLGTVRETNLDKVWVMMQGETWSPRGEARGLIRGLHLEHTSMSVGDAIKIGSKLFMVDRAGFVEL